MFNSFFIFNMWKFQVDGEEEVQLYIRRVNSEMVLNFFNNLEGENIFFRFSVCWHCWNLHLECHLSNGFDSCLQLGPAIFWSNLVAYFSNFQTTSKLWNVVINVSFLAKENLLVTVEASELLNDKNDSTDSKDKSGSITKALKYVVKGNFELVCFNINTFDFVS